MRFNGAQHPGRLFQDELVAHVCAVHRWPADVARSFLEDLNDEALAWVGVEMRTALARQADTGYDPAAEMFVVR